MTPIRKAISSLDWEQKVLLLVAATILIAALFPIWNFEYRAAFMSTMARCLTHGSSPTPSDSKAICGPSGAGFIYTRRFPTGRRP